MTFPVTSSKNYLAKLIGPFISHWTANGLFVRGEGLFRHFTNTYLTRKRNETISLRNDEFTPMQIWHILTVQKIFLLCYSTTAVIFLVETFECGMKWLQNICLRLYYEMQNRILLFVYVMMQYYSKSILRR